MARETTQVGGACPLLHGLYINDDMIDAVLRKSLSQDIRRLITGRMTNDAFDDVYYNSYIDSRDRAISEIATFGYSLYSSDVWPYRLRGQYAADKETRSAAARCVLFLRSGCDYQWPPLPHGSSLSFVCLFYGIPLGAALSFLWLSVLFDGWEMVVGSCAALGTLILAASIAGLFHQPPMTDEQRCFYAAGEFEVWPFLRGSDFDEARNSCHLLGGRLQ